MGEPTLFGACSVAWGTGFVWLVLFSGPRTGFCFVPVEVGINVSVDFNLNKTPDTFLNALKSLRTCLFFLRVV